MRPITEIINCDKVFKGIEIKVGIKRPNPVPKAAPKEPIVTTSSLSFYWNQS